MIIQWVLDLFSCVRLRATSKRNEKKITSGNQGILVNDCGGEAPKTAFELSSENNQFVEPGTAEPRGSWGGGQHKIRFAVPENIDSEHQNYIACTGNRSRIKITSSILN